MTYDEFMNIMYTTSPEDWTYDDDLGRYVYKHNIAITIKKDRDRDQSYHEDWTKRFADKKAYNEQFFLQYNGVTVKPFYCVSVDGYRAYLPFPHLKSGTVDPQDYRLVCILNKSVSPNDSVSHTNDYLNRAGFKVAEND